jgi:2-hydroxy-6-oxonona-2,4-dienedioate hydrolase
MEFKGFEKASFMGNSLGGHVALVYALQHQDRVDQLILTGSSGLYEKAFGDTFPRREDKEYVRVKTQDVFYDPAIATDELVDDVFETINNRGKLIRILAIAKSAIRHNMAADVPKILSQTCLIWGKQDGVTPPEVAEEFNRLMPNSDLYWIDKCGHAPMMEHPDEFNRILHAWFKEKAG